MPLLQPKSPLELDQAADDAAVLEIAEAAHHLSATMRNVHSRFWSRPTERLLATLNADVPTTLARFTGNTELATAANAALDAVGDPRFATRAPVVLGRPDIAFDGLSFMVAQPVDAASPG